MLDIWTANGKSYITCIFSTLLNQKLNFEVYNYFTGCLHYSELMVNTLICDYSVPTYIITQLLFSTVLILSFFLEMRVTLNPPLALIIPQASYTYL